MRLSLPSATSSTPLFTPAAATWYSPISASVTASNAGSLTQSQAFFFPYVMPVALTIDTLRLEVVAAGSAGCVLRAGVYAAASGGDPGALLSDLGTVAADTTGLKDWAIGGGGLSIPQGLMFFALCPQVASAATLTVRSWISYGGPMNRQIGATFLNSGNGWSVQPSITGALPSPGAPTSQNGSANFGLPRFFLHTV